AKCGRATQSMLLANPMLPPQSQMEGRPPALGRRAPAVHSESLAATWAALKRIRQQYQNRGKIKDDGQEAHYTCKHYTCNQMATTCGAPQCQSISARPVDERVSALMLEALSPSVIEASLRRAASRA